MNVIKRCKYGLMIYNQKDIYQGKSFQVYGEYSEPEAALFQQLLKPGDWAFEVGANIGSLTLPIARAVGPTGLVMVYEPERTAFYALAGNIAINNLRQVYCFHQAVSNTQGSMHVPELDHEKTDNFGGLCLDKPYSNCAGYTVPVVTLDALSVGKCNLIKADVEGMELQVLLGATNTINQHKPYLYVENDREDRSAALIDYIDRLGYTIYRHDAPFFNPQNFEGVTENVWGTNLVSKNLFCFHGNCPIKPEDFAMTLVSPQPL